MGRSLNVEHVAEVLPDLYRYLEDPVLRPIGLVGGCSLVLIGALLQLPVWSTFWTSVVSGVLVFVGVPLFCVGLAAPEPAQEDDMFRLGFELSPEQRRIVATGAMLVLFSPIVVAALGPPFGFSPGIWLTASLFALIGSVLIMTGFIAWTSRHIGEIPVSR